MKNLETNLKFDEELHNYYPIVDFNGKSVQYDPNKYELEKGESVIYLDFEEQKIKEGIIEGVEHSDPINFPIYTINGKPHMFHRVWPKVVGNKVNLSAQENKTTNTEKTFQIKEKSYLTKLLDLAQIGLKSIKIP
jgi:hypothetical protein